LVISYCGGIHALLGGVYSGALFFYKIKDSKKGKGKTESKSVEIASEDGSL
jgi:hypothetical protein